MTDETQGNPEGAPANGQEAPKDNAAPKQEAPKPEAKQDTPVNLDVKEGNKDTDADGKDTYEYQPTGDPALDVVLGFLGNLGIGQEDPAMAAAIKGDFDLLSAKLATMGDDARGWETMIKLGQDAYSRHAEKATKAADAVKGACHKAAGGEAEWKAVHEWANKNASKEEKAALNAMFDAGPFQAQAAADKMVAAYRNAGGTVVSPKSAVKKNGGGANDGTNSNGALSPKDYAAEVQKLYNKMGGRMDGSPEYRQLQARRAAYKQPK